MEIIGDIWLLRPLWLLLLPVVVAAVIWSRRRKSALIGWSKIMSPDLMQAMEQLGHFHRPQQRNTSIIIGIVLILLIIALSGPAVRHKNAPSFHNLDGVVFVVDLSPSVTLGGGALMMCRRPAFCC